VVPSFPELTPKAVGWLRENVFSAVDLGSDSTGWLYVSRQRANGRSVVNYLELKEFLEEREISVVYCEDLSLREQVELFRTADGIIAPHGAGLTNMVWGDNLHVVEIFNEVVQPSYNILAELMGHKYTSIVGTPVDSQFDKRNTNIKLDIDELDSILSMAEDAV
jgi:capsular polysaccharide biosynthesis protein